MSKAPSIVADGDALAAGSLLMWYEIRRVLGRGGFAVTYLAQDTHLQQAVAIKEYLPMGLAHRSGTDVTAKTGGDADYAWGRERFLAEARTLARFRHRNIVRVVSFFEANNTAYLVMDFEEGQSLGQYLAEHPAVDEARLLEIVFPLMDGLEVLHREGFIHRDIKPENIYLRRDGSPVLLDFGAARHALGGQTQNLTALLSPGYAPLEQYFSQKDRQGPWSDIYAMGAVMYRIISGLKPAEASLRSSYLINGMDDPLKSARQVGLGRYSTRLLDAVDLALRLRENERPRSLAEWRQMMCGDLPAATIRSVPDAGALGSPGTPETPQSNLFAAANALPDRDAAQVIRQPEVAPPTLDRPKNGAAGNRAGTPGVRTPRGGTGRANGSQPKRRTLPILISFLALAAGAYLMSSRLQRPDVVSPAPQAAATAPVSSPAGDPGVADRLPPQPSETSPAAIDEARRSENRPEPPLPRESGLSTPRQPDLDRQEAMPPINPEANREPVGSVGPRGDSPPPPRRRDWPEANEAVPPSPFSGDRPARPAARDEPPLDRGEQACRREIESLCAGVIPGEGRIIACMRENSHRLSPECRGFASERPPRPPQRHTTMGSGIAR